MFYELTVLRHAKSAWPLGVRDLHRPLSTRGIRDAQCFGEALARRGQQFDVVFSSPAQRTRQTWDLVAEAADFRTDDVQFDDRLYAASWWDVMDVIRETPPAVGSMLIIGHNPSLEDLCGELADGKSDPIAVRELRTKFPTCASARIRSEVPWSRWGGQCGVLRDLWLPRREAGRRVK